MIVVGGERGFVKSKHVVDIGREVITLVSHCVIYISRI